MAHDLRDPGFLADPAATLARMRAEGPFVRTRIPILGEVLITTTDAAARAVLKDQDHFARDPARAGGRSFTRMLWWMPRALRPLLNNMMIKGGSDHDRLRGLVDRAFARYAIFDLRPELAAMADRLLDAMPPDRPVDLVRAYARPLPLLAICALLGIPEADRDRINRWIAPISAPQTALTLVRALPGLWRLARYFRASFAIHRVGAGPPGLIRELVHVEEAGDRLSEDELLGMVILLFLAGHETTVHLIGDAVLGCLDRPGIGPALAEDPARLPLAVEEFLRFFSPVMLSKILFVRSDVTVEGALLRRGDRVSAFLLAANHDPARVAAPETLDTRRRPNAHLGFGFGPHVCLGMQLARLETQVALERLFLRHPGLRLVRPREEVSFARRFGIRGLPRLEVMTGPRRAPTWISAVKPAW